MKCYLHLLSSNFYSFFLTKYKTQKNNLSIQDYFVSLPNVINIYTFYRQHFAKTFYFLRHFNGKKKIYQTRNITDRGETARLYASLRKGCGSQ